MAHVVWLKRDLRIADHEALAEAAKRGPVVVLYVYEPEVHAAPDFDPQHHRFADECLAEVERAVRERGGTMVYRAGTMPEVLEALHAACGVESLHSHEETGTRATDLRDRRVRAWCAARGVAWHEYAQTGVVRRLPTRDVWAKRWEARMTRPLVAAPARLEPVALDTQRRRTPAELGFAPSRRTQTQPGGASRAEALLASFLAERGVAYRTAMSSPVTAFDACSRLSAHIAYGSVSLKRVYGAVNAKSAELDARAADGEPIDARWHGALRSFGGRLHWHCHFVQKLEDEPRIEFENLARSYDGLREGEFDEARFAAWREGRTGYPMIDACMRALASTGWINFRMRAMLMSFASYHLWLHWRPTAVHLAREFLDFEPGIHYAQSQMQSGTTGINTLRIYSPAKQVLDHDRAGTFVRAWVPELARVPDAYLAEPSLIPPIVGATVGFEPGVGYPLPVVDHRAAVAHAKARLATVRRNPATRVEADAIVEKHGSRKPMFGAVHRNGRR